MNSEAPQMDDVGRLNDYVWRAHCARKRNDAPMAIGYEMLAKSIARKIAEQCKQRIAEMVESQGEPPQ